MEYNVSYGNNSVKYWMRSLGLTKREYEIKLAHHRLRKKFIEARRLRPTGFEVEAK
jgi:hypothetical protein